MSWKELFKNPALYDTLLLNCTYWITLAGLILKQSKEKSVEKQFFFSFSFLTLQNQGTQFTLLPLFMVNHLHLGPSKLGK